MELVPLLQTFKWMTPKCPSGDNMNFLFFTSEKHGQMETRRQTDRQTDT